MYKYYNIPVNMGKMWLFQYSSFHNSTHQFDGHIFVCVQIFSQPQFTKVSTADLFPNSEVGADHEDPRVAPRCPASMYSPTTSCFRHPFPFLCLSLPTSLLKIHKLVIPWPLHGYSPAMQNREVSKQPPGNVWGRWREDKMSEGV